MARWVVLLLMGLPLALRAEGESTSNSAKDESVATEPAPTLAPLPSAAITQASAAQPEISPISEELGITGAPVTSTHLISSQECAPCESQTGFRLRASAEYLYLKPKREGLDFAILDPRDNLAPEGSLESVNWKMNSGFRLSTALERADSRWFISASYFYFHSSNERSVDEPAGGTLYGLLVAPSANGGEFDQATAGSNIDMDVVDVALGKSWSSQGRVRGSYFIGPRVASVHQALDAIYTTPNLLTSVSAPQRFQGIGLRLGADSNLQLTERINAFGRASCSMIAGDVKTWRQETSDGGQTFTVNLTRDEERVIPVIELGAGLEARWESFQIAAGYEVGHWFNLVESYDIVELIGHPGKLAQSTSDLSLSGIFLRFTASF